MVFLSPHCLPDFMKLIFHIGMLTIAVQVGIVLREIYNVNTMVLIIPFPGMLCSFVVNEK